MPVTTCPPETVLDKLQELADCCGILTLDKVEEALMKVGEELRKDAKGKGKEIEGSGRRNE